MSRYHKGAFVSARRRLQAARAAFTKMQVATSLDALEEAWLEFVGASARVIAKLKAGVAKGERPGWLQQVLDDQDSDELLRYVRQSRNAEEHTLEDQLTRLPSHLTLRAVNPEQPVYVKHLVLRGTQLVHYEGDPVLVEWKPERVVVVPIRCRGVVYAPPATHNGTPFHSNSPVQIAEATLAYLTRVLEHAEETES